MTLVDRNNFIHYTGVPITTIGGVNDELGAIGILARYDFIVVHPHLVSGDIIALAEIMRAAKVINPTAKFFGYTSLGDAADVSTWQATVDQWIVDIPAQNVLDGIFIDNFGFTDGTGLATRDNQNTAVLYVYNAFLTGTPLQVVVSATNPLDALESYDTMADPKIATGAGIDYIVLDNFYFAGTTPTAEPIEHMYGRLEYTTAKAAPPAPAINATVLPTSKLGVLLGVSAGAATTSIPTIDYAKVLSLAEIYLAAGLGVMPTDAVTSHQYYYQDTANDFDQ